MNCPGTTAIRIFQNAVIVGLLQTSEYARSIFAQLHDKAAGSHVADGIGDLSDGVAARMSRQSVLEDPRQRFHFVMIEAVLGYRPGSPAEMLAQLARVQTVARQDNVTVGLIPADALLPLPTYHGFELLDDQVVSIDLFDTTRVSRQPESVSLYREVFDAYAKAAVTDIDPIIARHYKRYLNEAQVEMPGS